ncbi:MAG: DNA alkylation repair protein [Nanoarchaeota archaeon]|nr:DNA alkylation repair protein [Nanoarchaeota archaeon]
MRFEARRQLKKLSDKQFAENIKRYLKSPYEFYGIHVPEIRTMAKHLYEEHELKDFYKIFNRLWNSGYHEEMSLALYTLQLYEEEFDITTFQFLKPKLNDIKSWDQIDAVSSSIIGKILLKDSRLEKDIIRLSKSKNFWMRRIAIVSTLPQIKRGNIRLTMKLAEDYIHDTEPYIQKATGWMLREAGKQNPEVVKNFILKHMRMPPIAFSYATERELKDLRKLRKIKKLED